MAFVCFFFVELREILQREHDTLGYKPSSEEYEAGIEEFEVLGEFPTLLALAKGDPLAIDKVLLVDYATIYAVLLTEAKTHKFQRRLNKVYAEKK